eukprot:SAG31_NODE_1232_length_9211_cov_31.167581_2_plen_76_part_00
MQGSEHAVQAHLHDVDVLQILRDLHQRFDQVLKHRQVLLALAHVPNIAPEQRRVDDLGHRGEPIGRVYLTMPPYE